MLISLKVKTLDAQTHELSVDNEITVREFKDKVAEKTNIAAEQQRIIYCGRVLADEKKLKEYDVNGKVVHVAERPPPSARGPSSGSSASNADNPPRRTARGMRSSPLFRALDGMVVGTMAIPMNPGMNNAQMQINPFTSSSSFCMNRITVARHMLECANNIAAFLEDPSRGLNNTSLDILAQGRWTMESTVVEVGITAGDIPQEQNIVDMLEGAVSAALRRNGNTNVTVVQLPTVFGPDDNPDDTHANNETTTVVVEEPMEDAIEDSADSAALNTSTSTEEMETAVEDDAVENIEVGVPDTPAPPPPSSTDVGAVAGTSSSTTSVGSSNSGSSGTTTSSATNNTVEPNSPNRRRTGTNVLADVIDQMRAVQTRLNPFIEQFYNMLRNEPTFEENDTTGRENAQRLYDRVSEAFHYMSHAQHAISDLLLDVSQPTPRYLACRPILVEQSGYVSSNNYLSAAAAAAAAGLGSLGGNGRQQPQQQQQQAQASQSRGQTPTRASQSQAQRRPQANAESRSASVSTAAMQNAPVEDPVDDPIVPPVALNTSEMTVAMPAGAAINEPNGNNANNDNPQMQVARLIQAVVNSAPIDAEFHVQINAPSIVSFGVPLNASGNNTRSNDTQQHQQSTEATTGTATANNNANENNSPTETASNASTEASTDSPNQARATTATLPTTATQTRSTSRPHVQIGNLPSGGWNGRVIPANMMSSFDRFLPCNSHHVRDSENTSANNSNTANSNRSAQTGQTTPNNARVNQRTLRTITDLFRHGPTIVTTPPLLGVRAAAGARQPAAGTSTPATRTSDQQTDAAPAPAANSVNETMRRLRVRVQLLNFINEHMFNGIPINEDNMNLAVNKAIRWLYDVLIFLPQYDLPQYDSRDSIENLIRHSLPLIINLVNSSDINENSRLFEQRLKELCAEFIKRLFSILVVCAGRVNAEIYWCELMRTLMTSLRSNFREEAEALEFLQIYVNTTVPTATDTNDAQQFLVLRSVEDETSETDSDVEMAEVPSTSQNSRNSPGIDNPEAMQLDPVAIGTEDWHSNFPAEWVPIISRDIQRQKEMQTSQAPFSDAYISGMSVKRRKIIQSSKPISEIKSLISDSVKEAIQAAGVGNSTASNQSLSSEEITAAISTDANVQASCTEALRSSFRDRLKTDADYKAERFPQTSKFLNK